MFIGYIRAEYSDTKTSQKNRDQRPQPQYEGGDYYDEDNEDALDGGEAQDDGYEYQDDDHYAHDEDEDEDQVIRLEDEAPTKDKQGKANDKTGIN